ncbi:MAG: GNAT family protein [Acidimicrobiia bacterium]
MLAEQWPFFNLRVTTPRVELRYPTDDDLARIVALVSEPIHDRDFMPFSVPWTRVPAPRREREALQWWWRSRTDFTTAEWRLHFGVWVDGEPVGVQDVSAHEFPVTRSVTTGSWIVQRRHGEGIGKEMRAAVLHLAFAGLEARDAHTSAFFDNAPSLGVTRSLGYLPNGSRIDEREGQPARHNLFVLPRAVWEQRRRDDITIDGLTACLDPLGLGEDDGHTR